MTTAGGPPNDGSGPDQTEMSADDRYAAEIKAAKRRHKEVKEKLKLELAQGRAHEQAEARRKEDRRDYLIGHAIRQDRSEAAIALVSFHVGRFTHPSDRHLFGLSPLPEDGDKSADPPMDETEIRGEGDDDQVVGGAPTTSTMDGLPTLLDMEEEKGRSEQAAQPDPMIVVSGDQAGRNERGAEEAEGEISGDVPHGLEPDRADALMRHSDERDDVASAGPSVENRQADPDRAGKKNASSSSSTPPEDIDPGDEGTSVQAADLSTVEQASTVGSAGPSSFAPQIFLSEQDLKKQIDQTGAKRTRSDDGRWIATAVTPEQAVSLAALKLQPYKPK